MSQPQTFRVQGMTCASCERTVQKTLAAQPGVIDATVSIRTQTAVVRMKSGNELSLNAVNSALQSYGYRLLPQTCEVKPQGSFSKRLTRAIWAVVIVGVVMAILSPLRVFIPSVDATASIGALFAFGIVASVSTCLATTGGFLLAYSAKAASAAKTREMHLGRLVSFAIGGAILGLIGGALPHGSVVMNGLLGLILGVGFLIVALSLLDLSPSLARFGIRLPSSFATWAEKVSTGHGRWTSFAVGAVTFILPCGFTQTAQALALASGSWSRGAMLLTAFALGTLPVLYGVTAMASKATLQSKTLRTAAGAVMFFFAVSQMNGGLVLLGSPVSFDRLWPSSDVAAAPVEREQTQIVRMDVTSAGYEPSSFTIKKGVPVRWEINGIDVGGCTNEIVSRQLGIARPLQKGLNVITFTPTQAGRISFACGMGMVRGSFNVI